MLHSKQLLIACLIMAVLSGGCLPRQPMEGAVRSAPAPVLEPAAHVGGAAVSIAVRGDYAYLGLSHELIVLDMADRARPRQIATLPTPATEIELINRYAYVVGRDGLHIIDIAEPSAPHMLGQWRAERTLADIVVVGDFAYIVSYSDFYVLAVADPHMPQLVSHGRFDVRFEGIAAAHGYIYAISQRGFHTFDVTVPTRPRQVGFVATESIPSGSISMPDDAYFGGEYLLQRIDLSSPMAPRRASALPMPGWVGDAVIADGIAYLATGSTGLQIWDLHDEQMPVQLTAYHTEGLATALAVDNGYIYLVDCDAGLQIFAAADPAHVQKVGDFTTLGIAYALAANDSVAYVAGGFNGGLHRVDVDQAAGQASISAHLPGDDIHDVKLADNLLYLIDGNALKIFDVTGGAPPQQIGAYDLKGENALKVNGHLAYLSNNQGDVSVLNVSNPAEVKPVTTYQKLGFVNAMSIDHNYVYIAHRDTGMHILVGAKEGMLTQVGQYAVGENVNKVAVQDAYAYLALGSKGLQVVDISNPAQPRWITDFSVAGPAKDLVIGGRYAHVAADAAGVQVLDILDPRAPASAALYPTFDCATGVAMTAAHLYVVDGFGGLMIYAVHEADPNARADSAFADVKVIPMERAE
ncbi:MAG: hypothetical protein R2911_11675 [Caldilineaceae bacterium]